MVHGALRPVTLLTLWMCVLTEGVHMKWVAHSPKHAINEAEWVVHLMVVNRSEGRLAFTLKESTDNDRAIVNHNRCPSALVPLERRTCFGKRGLAYMVTKFYLNLLVYLGGGGGWLARGHPTAAHSCRLFECLTCSFVGVLHKLKYSFKSRWGDTYILALLPPSSSPPDSTATLSPIRLFR